MTAPLETPHGLVLQRESDMATPIVYWDPCSSVFPFVWWGSHKNWQLPRINASLVSTFGVAGVRTEHTLVEQIGLEVGLLHRLTGTSCSSRPTSCTLAAEDFLRMAPPLACCGI